MVEKQCRFCLATNTLLIDIYRKSNAGTPKTLLQKCIPNFKDMETSSLPRFICFKCFAFVEHMHNFVDMTKKSFSSLTSSSQNLQMNLQKGIGFETNSLKDVSAIKIEESKLMSPTSQSSQAKLVCSPVASSHLSEVGLQQGPGSSHKVPNTPPQVQKKKRYKKTPLKQANELRIKKYFGAGKHKLNITFTSPSSRKWAPSTKFSQSVNVKVITNDRRNGKWVTDSNTPNSKASSTEVKNYCYDCRKSLPSYVNLFEHSFAMHSKKKA